MGEPGCWLSLGLRAWPQEETSESYKLEVTSVAPWSGMRGFQQLQRKQSLAHWGHLQERCLVSPETWTPEKVGNPDSLQLGFRGFGGHPMGADRTSTPSPHLISPAVTPAVEFWGLAPPGKSPRRCQAWSSLGQTQNKSRLLPVSVHTGSEFLRVLSALQALQGCGPMYHTP